MILEQRHLLDDFVEDLLTEAGITHPPVDPLRIADHFHITIVYDSGQSTRGRHKRLGSESVLFIKPDDRPERNSWVIAHELGEVWAAEWVRRASIDLSEFQADDRENFANRFASHLLLPGRWFAIDAEMNGRNFHHLKHRYRTASYELIGWRMLDLPQPVIVTLCDQGRVVRRRCNWSGRPPSLMPVEFSAWQTAHRESLVSKFNDRGITIDAWPIHEPHWKREIIHTLCPDDGGEVAWHDDRNADLYG